PSCTWTGSSPPSATCRTCTAPTCRRRRRSWWRWTRAAWRSRSSAPRPERPSGRGPRALHDNAPFLCHFLASPSRAMNIAKDTAVTLSYRITDQATAQLLDSGHVAYLHGGYDNIFAKVEAALEGQAAGHAATVDLAVEDAFG